MLVSWLHGMRPESTCFLACMVDLARVRVFFGIGRGCISVGGVMGARHSSRTHGQHLDLRVYWHDNEWNNL